MADVARNGRNEHQHPEAELIEIAGEDDIVLARQQAREVARSLGLGPVDQSRVATAVSELTRNVVRYATDGRGEVRIRTCLLYTI
jgi:serine/threonine-protein kinase RsbT